MGPTYPEPVCQPPSFPRVQIATAEDIAKAQSSSTKMLLALGATGKHIYQGTVPAAEKARRRAKNKVARITRRINRKGL